MKLIEMLIVGKDFAFEIFSSSSHLVGLLRLVKVKRHANGVLAVLSLLKTVSSHENSQELYCEHWGSSPIS
jgi:hypothetical protein